MQIATVSSQNQGKPHVKADGCARLWVMPTVHYRNVRDHEHMRGLGTDTVSCQPSNKGINQH